MILLINVTSFCYSQDRIVPRPVMEWCLECQSTIKIYFKLLAEKDTTINNQRREISSYKIKVATYEIDSAKFAIQNQKTDSLFLVDDRIIDAKTDRIKELNVNKWLERIAWGALTALLVVLLSL